MLTPLLCNVDFEMNTAGLTLSAAGPAARWAQACARMFSLCGTMGSSMHVAMGKTLLAVDGDAWRNQAVALGLYRAETAAKAPWNRTGSPVVAYAQDERVDALCAQLNLTPPQAATVTTRVNSKAFSLRHAQDASLEPGIFAHARTVESVSALERHLSRLPESVVSKWVLKPVLGFAGGGKISGHGGTLGAKAVARLEAVLARDGAMVFEPWVERTADHSHQIWVTARGEVQHLMQGALFNTASGRYQGNGSFLGSAGVGRALESAAAQVGHWLHAAGYAGAAGVDAFEYQDPLTHKVELRPVVEINARFTLGCLSGFAASMAAPPRAAWRFTLDETAPFGRWGTQSAAPEATRCGPLK